MGQTVVAIGLQQTGKTTFLAALWDVLQSGEVSGSLSLERTDGDMQYLNEIRIAWADCKPLGRTSPSGDRAVVMRLRELGKDTAVELAWTDMLGESFERQWTERSWTRRYQTTVESARGLVLFLHPERVIPSALILDALEAVAVLKKGGAPTPKRRRGANRLRRSRSPQERCPLRFNSSNFSNLSMRTVAQVKTQSTSLWSSLLGTWWKA